MTDPNAVAGYRRMLARAGQQVTFIRITGVAPHAQQFQATVTARVTKYAPDSAVVGRTDFSANRQGAITQGDRKILVLADDLASARFPLPLAKNDRVVVNGETLNIISVDPNTHSLSGAIEAEAAGV